MKQPEPVDGPTYARTNAVLIQARTRGLSAVEELNRTGLLLTPAARKHLRTEILAALVMDLERWRPVELLRRRLRHAETATPQDMYNCILDFVQEYLAVVEKES